MVESTEFFLPVHISCCCNEHDNTNRALDHDMCCSAITTIHNWRLVENQDQVSPNRMCHQQTQETNSNLLSSRLHLLESVASSSYLPRQSQTSPTNFPINSASTISPFLIDASPAGKHNNAFAPLKLPILELLCPPVLTACNNPSPPALTTAR